VRHAVLLEIFTDSGVGTEVTLEPVKPPRVIRDDGDRKAAQS